jgi:hypothetical protein
MCLGVGPAGRVTAKPAHPFRDKKAMQLVVMKRERGGPPLVVKYLQIE